MVNEGSGDHVFPEISGKPQKIFRVPTEYGMPTSYYRDAVLNRDVGTEQEFLNIFRLKGFVITRGGLFNQNNPTEFGVGMIIGSPRDAYKRIAKEVGIEMPGIHSSREILESEQKIVAKLSGAQRGESKFLLETKNQKVKFLAWVLSANKISDLYSNGVLDEVKMEQLLRKVAKGDFSDEFFNEKGLDHWAFEDYIETPGDYNTSLRVVVDGLGVIQYTQVARSDSPKDTSPSLTTGALPTTKVDLWGENTEIYLEYPDSPFYIMPKPFVSNVARGGKPILLNGIVAEDEVDRKVLEDLGIDPNSLKLPDELVKISSKIGKKSRSNYPYVGIDFLKDKNTGEYLLLEINTGPHLRPEALGLPSSTSDKDTDLELLRMILDNPILQ